MKYAVVVSGGKQLKVAEGDIVVVDNLNLKKDDAYTFPQVLLVVDEGKVLVGAPIVDGAQVTATVIENKKGEKVRVAKFKAKAKYRRVRGFRARLTEVKVGAITVK